MKSKPKCEVCGEESIELFETKFEDRTKWACNKCKSLKYDSIRGTTVQTRRKHGR